MEASLQNPPLGKGLIHSITIVKSVKFSVYHPYHNFVLRPLSKLSQEERRHGDHIYIYIYMYIYVYIYTCIYIVVVISSKVPQNLFLTKHQIVVNSCAFCGIKDLLGFGATCGSTRASTPSRWVDAITLM